MTAAPIQIRVNVRPTEQELSDLCEAVGWTRFGNDYAALDGYSTMVSGWTTDGRLIAWTSIISDNVRHAFVHDVMVRPDLQRRGIGRSVVLRAIEEMKGRGVTTFHVDCDKDHAGFYAKCGFKLCAGGWLDTTKDPLQSD